MTRVAVVLFNLGGPDGPDAVRPFLENLFRDPAIIRAPAVVRYPLASLISRRREASAKANYALMGGGSPLLPETERQAAALEARLRSDAPEIHSRVFVAMRYWKPLAAETAAAVADFRPDEIVLLPLYPQYSTTTTGSSLAAWREAYAGKGRTRTICCYPAEPGLVSGHAGRIRERWEAAKRPERVRLLFSAHGLPERVVAAGDPYQAQVEATAAAVAAQVPELPDWRICYQSRVGPMKWIGPSTDAEIRRAGAEGLGVLISPIAFVSEHVETLVELDHDYAAVAEAAGCAPYLRVPALGLEERFIGGLASTVLDALRRGEGSAPAEPWRCPGSYRNCALRGAGA